MRVTVTGLGYVGLVTAACLAERGHDVIGVDIDPRRVARLREGEIPFHEPGLPELVSRHVAAGSLAFTTVLADAAPQTDVAIIAVGTHDGDGGWQTRTIERCLRDVVPMLGPDAVLAIRSTLPPDLLRHLPDLIRDLRQEADLPALAVAINPEFTAEATAVRDFMHPDRVVIGVLDDPRGLAVERLSEIYEPFGAPILVMPAVDAVLTKLAANLFLATKISFANELAAICAAFGANVEQVTNGIGRDPRIGPAFLRAGVGFGGSCLPNQVTMMVRAASRAGVEAPLLAAVEQVNLDQRTRFVGHLASLTDGLEGARVALLGLTFKPGTDDLRDAPSLAIAWELLQAGARVCAYDPMPSARERAAASVPGLEIATSAIEALAGADVAGLVTEWPEFRRLDWRAAGRVMAQRRLVDGRNALDPGELIGAGFTYRDLGRTPGAPPGQVGDRVLAALPEALEANVA